MQTSENIAIRRATQTDRVALRRLAALDSAEAPSGEVIIAEVGEEPRAAIELGTGTTIADPFRRTRDLVELLRVRASSLRPTGDASRGPRLRLRSAYRAA